MMILFFMMFMIPLSFFLDFWLMLSLMFMLLILSFKMMSFNYIYMYISYWMGFDLMSFFFILLSIWICSLMFLASFKLYINNYYKNLFLLVMMILLLSLFLVFSSLNLFMFYLFFEISLIPTLFLIIGWGYQPERLEAGMYLFFYTLFASLPMLISIFYLYDNLNSLEFMFLKKNFNNMYLYMLIMLVFLIKLPMFFVHLWLPKAHVEAPISGSMILAGLMLKLGGYGMMRLMSLFINLGMKVNLIFIVISMVGGCFVSFMCLRQSDMKMLIAYSSVAHMGLVLSGIMTMNMMGMYGSLLMMLAHGLCSSGLFCLANFSYERILSRSIYLNKGLINLIPMMSLWWFIFSCSNMAAPPSMNLLGEIFLINSLVTYSNLLMIFLMIMSFMSAVYSLFLYSYIQHGQSSLSGYSFYYGTIREYLLMYLHFFPLFMFILKSELISLWI